MRILVVASVLFAFVPAYAGELSLDDCVSLALENNPGFASSVASTEVYDHGVRGAWGAFLPSLSGSGSYRYTRSGPSSESYSYNGQTFGSDTETTNETWTLSVGLSQDIWAGGGNISGIRSANARRDAARQRLRSSRAQLVLSVKEAYYGLLRAKMELDLAIEQVGRTEEQMRFTRARAELEAATRAEVLRVEVALAVDQLAEVQAVHAVSQAELTLRSLLGFPLDRPIDLAESLEPIVPVITREQAVAEALANSPELLSARASARASRHGVGSARSSYLPRWSASAGYSWSGDRLSDAGDAFDNDYSWYVGTSVSISLFDMPSRAAVGNAKASARAELYAAEEIERAVVLSVERTYESYLEATAANDLAQVASAAAEEDLSIVEERYRIGAASLLELLDTRVAYLQAKSSEIQAAFDLNLSVAALESAMGIDW
jgi:outer membrane protein